MQVIGGVAHDTQTRANEAQRAIHRAAADAAALDGKLEDGDPAPGSIRLDGVRIGREGRWWGQVEADPASGDLKKAWLAWRHAPLLGATESATYVYSTDDAHNIRVGSLQSSDGFLRGSLTILDATLNPQGEAQTATTILGQPGDLPSAHMFLRDDACKFWAPPLPLPVEVERVV